VSTVERIGVLRRLPGHLLRRRLVVTAGLGLLLVWGWFDVRGRALPETGRTGQMTDLTVYTAAARALRSGQDLYRVRNVRNWPYLYPPPVALLFVPLSDLPRGTAAYLWFLVSLASLAGGVVLMRASLGLFGARLASRAAFFGLLIVLLPALHTLQRSQVNHLCLLFVCLSLYALSRGREALAGMCLAGAAAVKVTPGLAAVWFAYKWLHTQRGIISGRRWRPRSIVAGSDGLVGFALGLVVFLFVIPSLYVGPGAAARSLMSWRQTVARGYFVPDAAGNVFSDIRGIRDMSEKNQSWYRAAAAWAQRLDPHAMQSRDALRPDWQRRIRWVLLAIGLSLTAGLLYLSGPRGAGSDTRAVLAEIAVFSALVWLGVSFGKIAWGHFYVMVYPLAATAWLLADLQAARGAGRSLRYVFWAVVICYLLHYGPAVQTGLGKYGTLLLPTGILAVATVAAAGRRSASAERAVASTDSAKTV